MKLNKIRRSLVLAGAVSTFALGCELIVDFDRTKIPVEETDSATLDAATVDSAAAETGAAADATTDADATTASDASSDAADASDDGG